MFTLHHPLEEISLEALESAFLLACAHGWRPTSTPMSDEERDRPTIPAPAFIPEGAS